ncbi:MAG TPA: hypothetical protein VHB98_11020, partial [Chloroflexota bacterium]|nr:hypothetical protein [Chloroflexota bacterium]
LLPHHVLGETYASWVRVSKTGDLVTVWDWEYAVLPPYRARIATAVTDLGLLYVPTWVLETPYTGRVPGVSPAMWSERLFGYCDPPAEV